jgi:hypothetical protein
MRSVVLAQQGF